MADTKQTKTIDEHHVAAELARRGWAPALTRDGLERTDILAAHADGTDRRQIEVQVKTTKFKDRGGSAGCSASRAKAERTRARVLRPGRRA